jgi:hypothetical protein
MSFKVKFLSDNDNNNENDINKNNIIFFKNDSIFVFILKKDVSLNKNEFYDAHDDFFS